jgi:tetratricopeptide (TPR) repeat protein
MRQRKTLIIRRDDHNGDPIGGIFLDPDAISRDELMRRMAQYLGPRVVVLEAELGREQIELRCDAPRHPEASVQLAAAANDLRIKGAPRNAQSLFAEALALDPFNGEAMLGLAQVHIAREQWPQALATLKRARGYLERALELAPNNPELRRALKALGPEVPQPASRRSARVATLAGHSKS